MLYYKYNYLRKLNLVFNFGNDNVQKVRDLGEQVGGTEINYLMILPLNGDPIEV